MSEENITESEVVNSKTLAFREVDSIIQEELLSWLDSSEALDPTVKNEILSRLVGLRTKFQVLMVEAQKQIFRTFVLDLETENIARDYLRSQIPYMSNKERTDVIKTLASVGEDRLSRLETQLTGFDFLNTTAMSLGTLSELKTSEEMVTEVRKLEPQRRAKLLIAANEIIKEINNLDTPENVDGTTEV